MSVISALITYFQNNTDMADHPIWVDYLGERPTEYSIAPLPGTRTIATYLDGKKDIEYPFAINAVFSTASDIERLDNSGSFESLATWMETQTDAASLPTLDAGSQASKIEATGWGYLFEQGESETGIYQIQCRLTYKTGYPITEPEPEPDPPGEDPPAE